MKLAKIRAQRYRSLADVEVDVEAVNLLIGANASGKSNVLDLLAFANEGIIDGDFENAVSERGGLNHLAWKGAVADDVRVELQFEEAATSSTWSVEVRKSAHRVEVVERLDQKKLDEPSAVLLEAHAGKVWWKTSQATAGRLQSTHGPTVCALAQAEADESFEGRGIAEFVRRWGFFDPSPRGLRRAADAQEGQLWRSGANLAAHLRSLEQTAPERYAQVIRATQRVLGVPEALEFRESADGKVYFTQREPGLRFAVHQVGASSGTLRMLALMAALYGDDDVTLVGIEEPENYVHPKALTAFAEYLRDASAHAQLMITTHSPLLLDVFAKPDEVMVVRRSSEGTKIERVEDPSAVGRALEESGFGLGELLETEGFGG